VRRTAEQYEADAARSLRQAEDYPSQGVGAVAVAQVYATLALAAAVTERPAGGYLRPVEVAV